MILTCHEETTDDDGMLAPCGEHAVAYRYDPEHIDRAPYPVCVEHVRAPMAVLRRSDDVKLDALVGFAVKVHTRPRPLAGVDSEALKGELKSEPATEGTLMSEPVWCVRGCYAWGKHLPDCDQRDDHNPGCVDDACPGCNAEQCPGCQPREAYEGVLCAHCCQVLGVLLAGPDDTDQYGPVQSVAYVCAYLAEQLHNPYRCNLGKSGRGSGEDDAFVRVFTALTDLQIAWAELATDFLGGVDARPVTDRNPAAISARLRPFARQLCAWGAIADTIDHLIELRDAAHAVAPWRGKNPDAADEVAAVLYLAPAETTGEICARFGLAEQWIKDARRRHGLRAVVEGVKPLSYRPWQVYELLHPKAATDYEARLARASQRDTDDRTIWTSDTPNQTVLDAGRAAA